MVRTATPTKPVVTATIGVPPYGSYVGPVCLKNSSISTNSQYSLSRLDLVSVSLDSKSDGWAIGLTKQAPPQQLGSGVLVHYSAGAWNVVGIATNGPLNSIMMIDSHDGWAVGYGVILHFDGTCWTSVPSPTALQLRSISMVSANDVWIVGDQAVILHYNGMRWNVIPVQITPPPGVHDSTSELSSVSMSSASDGWAMGGFNAANQRGLILHYTNGVWTQSNIVTATKYKAVSMTSAQDGWAIGESDHDVISHFHNGKWVEQEAPAPLNLSSIQMISASDGWLVGQAGLYRFTSGTWRAVDVPESENLLAISMISSTEGWVVGLNATLVHLHAGVWSLGQVRDRLYFARLADAYRAISLSGVLVGCLLFG